MDETKVSEFNFGISEVWYVAGVKDVYRWLPPDVAYSPIEPWSGAGRFDNAETLTLYVGLTPSAALAEYFRRNPKLLQFQKGLKIRLFQIQISTFREGADVSNKHLAEVVGIEWEKLRSSDLRKSERYQRCRELAETVLEAGGISIRYPSAALDSGVNVVLFGSDSGSWFAKVCAEIALPWIEPSMVRALPPGAEP